MEVMEVEVNTDRTAETPEIAADGQDAFLQGWDGTEDSFVTEPADQQEQPEQEAETEQDDEAQTRPEAEAGNTDPEQTQDEPEPKEAEEPPVIPEAQATWTLNYMGREQVLGAKDITPELLQKGMDYDRVREKYDEAKPVIELFSQYARQANMSLGDYARHIRQQAKQAGGMSREEAARTVDLEDREAAIAAKEQQRTQDARAVEVRKAKVAEDIRQFAKAFPEVYESARSDPKAIPDSVWAEVNSGAFSLTSAYARYAVGRAAKEQARAIEEQQTALQNQKNRLRSTGSQVSAGSEIKSKSAFLEGFDG